MAYTKQTWVNAPSTLSKLNATRLNYIEAGLEATSAVADNALAAANAINTEYLQDFLNANIAAGTGLTKTYDDAGGGLVTLSATGVALDEGAIRTIVANTIVPGTGMTETPTGSGSSMVITLDVTGGGGGGGVTLEQVMDLLGNTFIVAGTGITKSYNDAGDTLTINGLQVGSAATDAKAGNWKPLATDLPANSLGMVVLSASNPAATATRPNFPSVLWVGGTVEPANRQSGTDAWIGSTTTVSITYATVVFTGDAEGVALNGDNLTTSNTPFTAINKGGGTATGFTSALRTPAVGSKSYTLTSAAAAIDALDFTGSTAYNNWSGELWFRFPTARPAATCVIWREYNGTVGTGTDQTFTVSLTSAGALLFGTFNAPSTSVTIGTATGVTIAVNTWYRLRCEGDVTANTVKAILDTGGSAAAIWSDTFPGDSVATVKAAKDHRVGIATSQAAATTMDLEFKFGFGPGYISPSYTG